MLKRRRVTVSFLTGVVMGLAVAFAVPALAHWGTVYKNYGLVNRGKALSHSGGANAHWYVDSCDESSDGWQVRAWAYVVASSPGPQSWDPDGDGGLCAHNTTGVVSWRGHKVCVEVAGCAPAGYVTH